MSDAKSIARKIRSCLYPHRRRHANRARSTSSHRKVLYPSQGQDANVELSLGGIYALAAAGDALHFYLWLVARSTRAAEGKVTYQTGDYGLDEQSYLTRLVELSWVKATKNVTTHGVQLLGIRTIDSPF